MIKKLVYTWYINSKQYIKVIKNILNSKNSCWFKIQLKL